MAIFSPLLMMAAIWSKSASVGRITGWLVCIAYGTSSFASECEMSTGTISTATPRFAIANIIATGPAPRCGKCLIRKQKTIGRRDVAG
jgi:hypothetical protein